MRETAHTQRRLCLLYVAPVIDAVTCQEIKTSHMQQIVNAFGHGGWRVAQWVDPAEITSDDDVAKLGHFLAAGTHGHRDELMANTAAYSGLRCEDDAGRPCVVGKGHVRTPDGDSDQEMGVVVGCLHVQFALKGPPVALSLPTVPVGRQFGEEQCRAHGPSEKVAMVRASRPGLGC